MIIDFLRIKIDTREKRPDGILLSESKREGMLMKKERKGTMLVASLCLAVSLSGCYGDGDSIDRKAQAAAMEVDASDPMSPYGTELVLSMGRYTGTNPRLPEGDTFEDNAYTRYLKERLNITIKDAFEANGDDYNRQVSLAMAGNDLPDIMTVTNWKDLQELVENDMVADLTDVYDKYASDELKRIYATYDEVFEGGAFGKVTFDGRMYGMPDAQGDSGPNMVWVRQDWADKLGLNLDEDGDGCLTVEELKKTAEVFAKEDPGETGKPVGIPVQPMPTSADNDGGSFTLTGLANAFGAFPKRWQEDANGEIVYGTLTDETKEFLTEMAQWYQEGIIDPQCGVRTWDDCMSLLVNNQAGIVFGQWHMPDWAFTQIKTKNPECEFMGYAIADKQGTVTTMHVAPIDKFMVVSKDCPHPEALIKIMNIYFDEISGTDAAKKMPNIAEALQMDNSTKPVGLEVQASDQLLQGYRDIEKAIVDESLMPQLGVYDQKMAVEIKAYRAEPENASTEEWSHYNSRVNGLGLFSKLTEENTLNWKIPAFTGSTSSMPLLWTNLDKQENEMVIKIITGSEPPEYFETFKANWNKQGGASIVDEVRTQVKH